MGTSCFLWWKRTASQRGEMTVDSAGVYCFQRSQAVLHVSSRMEIRKVMDHVSHVFAKNEIIRTQPTHPVSSVVQPLVHNNLWTGEILTSVDSVPRLERLPPTGEKWEVTDALVCWTSYGS
jgi:hypothetical protein